MEKDLKRDKRDLIVIYSVLSIFLYFMLLYKPPVNFFPSENIVLCCADLTEEVSIYEIDTNSDSYRQLVKYIGYDTKLFTRVITLYKDKELSNIWYGINLNDLNHPSRDVLLDIDNQLIIIKFNTSQYLIHPRVMQRKIADFEKDNITKVISDLIQ